MVNRKGDKGQPWRSLLEELKYPVIEPLQIIENGMSEMQALIQSTKILGNSKNSPLNLRRQKSILLFQEAYVLENLPDSTMVNKDYKLR